jgi:hypothetical protein
VLLADTLMERLEQFAPDKRDSAALAAIAALCPVCRARREVEAIASASTVHRA